jgi:hypothetical protein
MQVKLFDVVQKKEEVIIEAPKIEIVNDYVFNDSKPIFKQFIFYHILELFYVVRKDTKKVIRFKRFKNELRKRTGGIKEQVDIIVDALLDENYLKRDPDNVMDLTCKLINENLKLQGD